MKGEIKPKSKFEEGEDVVYNLEDKDYLLIKAIQDLTMEIQKARISYGR